MENDTNNENLDSLILDEDINLEENNTSEDVGKLKEQNKKLFERAKKAEGFEKQPDGSWVKKEKPQPKPQENITRNEYTLNDEVVDLRLDGYSKQEVDFIMKNGGRKVLEDKNSYVSIAINARKEQAKAEAEASKGVDTSGQSEFERKYTPEMLKNMTKEELAKILPHA